MLFPTTLCGVSSNRFSPPKGTADWLPPSSEAFRRLLRAWDESTQRFGFALVSTPIFEATELFDRGVGASTEVVGKQMYTFTDKGGRSLTLRPEGTAPVLRAYLNSGSQGVLKAAYAGPFFRYEQPQKGRMRQFFQLGAEFIGVDSPVADAEVIELGFRFLSEAGVPGLELRLNSVGCRSCRPAYVAALRSYLESRRESLSLNSQRLIDSNPLRVLDSKADSFAGSPVISDFWCEECLLAFDQVKTLLASLDIPYTEDPFLVRGLDYYSRTAFEFIATGLDASQNAVGGGGRYDGLAETLGGPPVPAVGLALGLERIVLSLPSTDATPGIEAFLVSEVGAAEALAAVSFLRREGVAVDFDAAGRSVKAQFRAAARSSAPLVLLLRSEDPEVVEVRDAGGGRWLRPLAELPAFLARLRTDS